MNQQLPNIVVNEDEIRRSQLRSRFEFKIGKKGPYKLEREIRLGSSTGDMLIDSPDVGALHVRLVPRGPVVLLQHLSSTHGTQVNGKRVRTGATVIVDDQDEIYIGPFLLDLARPGLERDLQSQDQAEGSDLDPSPAESSQANDSQAQLNGPPPPLKTREKRRRRWPWFFIGLLSLSAAIFMLFLPIIQKPGVLTPVEVIRTEVGDANDRFQFPYFQITGSTPSRFVGLSFETMLKEGVQHFAPVLLLDVAGEIAQLRLDHFLTRDLEIRPSKLVESLEMNAKTLSSIPHRYIGNLSEHTKIKSDYWERWGSPRKVSVWARKDRGVLALSSVSGEKRYSWIIPLHGQGSYPVYRLSMPRSVQMSELRDLFEELRFNASSNGEQLVWSRLAGLIVNPEKIKNISSSDAELFGAFHSLGAQALKRKGLDQSYARGLQVLARYLRSYQPQSTDKRQIDKLVRKLSMIRGAILSGNADYFKE